MMPTLLDILAEYGIFSAVIVTFIIIIVALLRSKVGGTVPVFEQSDEAISIYTHQFFSNIEFKINIDLPIETFSENANRNVMYQDIMVILFSTYLNYMKDFAKAIKRSWDANDWKNKINDVHYDIIEEFKKECASQGVPEEAIKVFMVWYNPYLNRIYQYINHVAKMPTVSPESKTRVFLLVLELILATVTADAQRQSILNGELNGIEYKGLVL